MCVRRSRTILVDRRHLRKRQQQLVAFLDQLRQKRQVVLGDEEPRGHGSVAHPEHARKVCERKRITRTTTTVTTPYAHDTRCSSGGRSKFLASSCRISSSAATPPSLPDVSSAVTTSSLLALSSPAPELITVVGVVVVLLLLLAAVVVVLSAVVVELFAFAIGIAAKLRMISRVLDRSRFVLPVAAVGVAVDVASPVATLDAESVRDPPPDSTLSLSVVSMANVDVEVVVVTVVAADVKLTLGGVDVVVNTGAVDLKSFKQISAGARAP
jgi:hypothetical protein